MKRGHMEAVNGGRVGLYYFYDVRDIFWTDSMMLGIYLD